MPRLDSWIESGYYSFLLNFRDIICKSAQQLEQKTPETQTSPMSEDQRLEAIKNFLFQQLHQKYQDLSKQVNDIPFNPELKKLIVMYFDTGFLWAKEAFQVICN